MKKTTFFIILTAALIISAVVLTTARNSKNRVTASSTIITKTLDVSEFNAIAIAGGMDVIYTQSDKVSASMRCPDNILKHLDIRVKGNTLIVAFKDDSDISMRNQNIIVTASSPHLNSASIAGSGDIKIIGGLVSQTDVNFRVSGSGDIECPSLTCQRLIVTVAGSGNIDCGYINATDVTVGVAGSGDASCKNVTATNIKTQLSGSGDINLESVVCESILATINGSGDIDLKGRANSASYTIAGSGEVKADYLETKTVVAKINGSGTIKCYATQTLEASTGNASGSILYRGNPETIITHNRVRPLD